MKKKITALIAVILVSVFSCFGCIGAKGSADTLTVIWDSMAFIYNFDDIDKAISLAESQLANGTGSPSEATKRQEQKKIDNTKLMAAWAAEKGKKIKCVDWGWADNLTQKLSASFIAGEGPDIICGEGQLPSFMEQGALQPFPDELSSYIKANVSAMGYSAMTGADGKIYGLSLCPSMTILVWNKNILREANVDAAIIENGPKTWAEWEAAMKKVSDMGNALKIPGGAYYGANAGGYLRVGALLNGVGGSYEGADGKPNVNTAQNGQALDFVKRTAQLNGFNTALKGTDSGYFSAFTGGNLAYIMDGVWAIQENSGLSFDVGYSYVPGFNTDKISNQLVGAGYLSVPVYSQNKELAFECIRRMIEEDIQQNIADAGLRTPILKSVYNSDKYKTDYPTLYNFAQFANSSDVKGLPGFSKAGDITELWNAFGTCLSKLTTSSNNIPVYSANPPDNTLLKTAQAGMMLAYNS